MLSKNASSSPSPLIPVEKAQQDVEKASAAVRFAKRDFIPDTEVFARQSYQNGVPFLQHNFGTFGFVLSYDIFDGGRKRAALAEHNTQLAEARENLARVKDVQAVKPPYNKLERTARWLASPSSSPFAPNPIASVSQCRPGSALTSGRRFCRPRTRGQIIAERNLARLRPGADELTVAIGRTPE